MPGYHAPLRDLQFVLHDLLDLPALAAACGREDFDAATLDPILEAAGRFAQEVIEPLDAVGDQEGCTLDRDGAVRTPTGYRSAYDRFAQDGWTALACAPEHGGQGLPAAVDTAVHEMLSAANMAWTAYPGMSHAAYICLEANGTEPQKALYLPKIVSGAWAGTMCLTEPHCGTDLGLLRTRAQPQPDGSYAITGTKIFISGGEHDLAGNIVHLVLARMPGSPPGVKGISLFIVPKFLPDANGAPGERNSLLCTGLEHKMGIHGNATCTMSFEGARGWLLGAPDRGLAAMFVMMNHARLIVGVSAIGLMDAAYQKALAYAKDRLQGRAHSFAPDAPGRTADPIIDHPDVRRMLLTQKCWVEGCRATALWASTLMDAQRSHPDAGHRSKAAELLALVTPVVKAFSSDKAVDSILLAMQCFGGHGYIRENRVEQHLRDARIIPLYEGTNGIQAMDLITRKVIADGGERMKLLLQEIEAFLRTDALPGPQGWMASRLASLCELLRELTRDILSQAARDPAAPGAAAVPYLRLVGHLLLAWMWARMAAVSARRDAGAHGFHAGKLAAATFYFERLLPETLACAAEIRAGAGSVVSPPADVF